MTTSETLRSELAYMKIHSVPASFERLARQLSYVLSLMHRIYLVDAFIIYEETA